MDIRCVLSVSALGLSFLQGSASEAGAAARNDGGRTALAGRTAYARGAGAATPTGVGALVPARREVARRLRQEMARSIPAASRIDAAPSRATEVRFTILRDGRLTGLALEESSGSEALDALTLAAVRRIGRVAPLQGGFEQLTITAPLRFSQ